MINTKHWKTHPTLSGWEFKNKAGAQIRIVCFDREGEYPLMDSNGRAYTEKGEYNYGSVSSLDLIMPTPVIGLFESVNGFSLYPGQQWHRADWTLDMLPAGYRPCILHETGECMEAYVNGVWVPAVHYKGITGITHPHRTRLPIPDPFVVLKAAVNAGKKIQMCDLTGNWHDVADDVFYSPVDRYRIKPIPVVPLTPDDVNIGDEIRRKPSSKYRSGILSISPDGVQLYSLFITWGALQEHYQINRKDGNGWLPCEKQENE